MQTQRVTMHLGGLPTAVLRKTARQPCDTWLIVVPGNPGLVDFYTEFIDHLYEQHQGNYTICAVGHAGHGVDPAGAPISGLEEQIEHKATFLQSCPQDVSFVLIGHSIGAYINLQVMKRYPDLRVRQAVNLFPTIQDLNSGLKPVVRWLMLPGFRHVLGTIAHWAPEWLKARLMSVYEANMRPEDKARARALMSYGAVNNILYMAHCESFTVTHFDETLVAPVQDRLVFLFAKHDRYTPLDKHCYALRARFPNMAVHVAEDPAIPHAFVQGYSEPVARLVAAFLTPLLSKSTSPLVPPGNS